jgi:hypothetical protein
LRTPDSGSTQPSNVDTTVDEHALSAINPLPAPETQLFLDALAWPAPAINGNSFDFPSFFGHIMDPDPNFDLTQSTQVPPDFSNLMLDTDWYNGNDIFGAEFTPRLDEAIDTISFGFPEIGSAASIASSPNVLPAADNQGGQPKIQHQSPWYAMNRDAYVPVDCD